MFKEAKMESILKNVNGKSDTAKEKTALKQVKELWESITQGTRQKYVKTAKEQLSQFSQASTQSSVGKKRARVESPGKSNSTKRVKNQ